MLFHTVGACNVCGTVLNPDQATVIVKKVFKTFDRVSVDGCIVVCRSCCNLLSGKHQKKLADDDVESCVKSMLEAMKLDLSDPNLEETPRRIATMYELMTEGLKSENEPSIQTFPNNQEYDQIAIVKARFMSMCSHHFMPFFGVAYFGYIPNGNLIGLSKIRRVIDYFAHRPQLQEQLTKQVIDYLHDRLKPKGCMLVVQATHLCIAIKDNAQIDCPTSTSAIKGCFEDEAPRNEFLTLIHNM